MSTVTKKLKYDALSISDASKSEILEFAKVEAGLVFDEGTSREYMLEQIFDALQWMHQDPTESATHVVIRIAKSAESGGQHRVRLGYQGRMITVEREKEVEVPVCYYNVLMDINSLGFTIPSLEQSGALVDESPLQQRIQLTKYPVTVLRFINKGK